VVTKGRHACIIRELSFWIQCILLVAGRPQAVPSSNSRWG